jgi:hypothetical protein
MKFEFVEFYPVVGIQKRKNLIGTVHIYIIECEMDIRGISVIKKGNQIFFQLPYSKGIDNETNKEIWYPMIIFTNETKQKEMIDFLRKKVKPEILKRISLDIKSK